MKKQSSFYRTFFSLILLAITSFSANSQQQFIQIASKENSYCNSTCTLLDIPELNKNPGAVILATPINEDGITPYAPSFFVLLITIFFRDPFTSQQV